MEKVLKDFINLKENQLKKFINDYNPLPLLRWQANVDC